MSLLQPLSKGSMLHLTGLRGVRKAFGVSRLHVFGFIVMGRVERLLEMILSLLMLNF